MADQQEQMGLVEKALVSSLIGSLFVMAGWVGVSVNSLNTNMMELRKDMELNRTVRALHQQQIDLRISHLETHVKEVTHEFRKYHPEN